MKCRMENVKCKMMASSRNARLHNSTFSIFNSTFFSHPLDYRKEEAV